MELFDVAFDEDGDEDDDFSLRLSWYFFSAAADFENVAGGIELESKGMLSRWLDAT